MQSPAKTVGDYLAELPEDRLATVQAVRQAILANLPAGYEEGMQYGMIGYYVPYSLYPKGYHCDPKQPLSFAALANQKNSVAVYLMGVYGSPELSAWFREAWAKTGKKLDMGKSCVRFKNLDGAALDVIGEVVARQPLDLYVSQYESLLKRFPARLRACRPSF